VQRLDLLSRALRDQLRPLELRVAELTAEREQRRDHLREPQLGIGAVRHSRTPSKAPGGLPFVDMRAQVAALIRSPGSRSPDRWSRRRRWKTRRPAGWQR
jgi:hypothetical protein